MISIEELASRAPIRAMGDATTVSAHEQALVSPTTGFGSATKGLDIVGGFAVPQICT